VDFVFYTAALRPLAEARSWLCLAMLLLVHGKVRERCPELREQTLFFS
jgi:hypothetical protein